MTIEFAFHPRKVYSSLVLSRALLFAPYGAVLRPAAYHLSSLLSPLRFGLDFGKSFLP